MSGVESDIPYDVPSSIHQKKMAEEMKKLKEVSLSLYALSSEYGWTATYMFDPESGVAVVIAKREDMQNAVVQFNDS